LEPHKKIVLISSGQPSLNPRLVKEADTLAGAGYEVTVLYAYWNAWGTGYDIKLLASKKWKAIRLAGDPLQKRITWFSSRLIFKTARYLLHKTGNYKYFAEFGIARSSYFLIKGAKKYKADLYIAHNAGALPAAAKAAGLYKKPFGFDAEDFHRQEVNDNTSSFHYQLTAYIEDKYLPLAAYVTASSPLIAEQYEALYKKSAVTLLNVFPKTPVFKIGFNEKKPLKLFWFSQTIGPNRGLEMIIEAISIAKPGVELHLLGQPADGYKQHLLSLIADAAIEKYRVYFYQPVKPEEIFHIAPQFDVGLASETGFCLNNNIALSNKIFTYIQSGLAVAASNTPAQSALMNQYSNTGKIYKSATELANILNAYNAGREMLYQTKKDSYQTGQTELNWETESEKFLKLVENV